MELMNVRVWELLVIGTALIFSVSEWIAIHRKGNRLDNSGDICWYVQVNRIGTAKNSFWNTIFFGRNNREKVGLEEGCYFVGNRPYDDIWISAGGKRVKLYLNIQKDHAYLSILKGRITIFNNEYVADPTKRIPLPEMTRITIYDIEMELFKRRGWP